VVVVVVVVVAVAVAVMVAGITPAARWRLAGIDGWWQWWQRRWQFSCRWRLQPL
jgi:hypothetical protein